MQQIKQDELYSLEKYAQVRKDFRAEVMDHKKSRQLAIGPHVTLYFEDRLTIHYQIQEMLRVERIFEAAGIRDELDAYNPLIPDGRNLKATMMIEYENAGERPQRLAELVGIEKAVWMRVDDLDKVAPIADEDLDRATEEKTAAVHFLRFEFTDEMVKALRGGAVLSAGIDHRAYTHVVDEVLENIRNSLIADFD